jgi:predicted heme/steroid binding protein
MKKIWIISLVLLLVILVSCSSEANNANDLPEKTFTIEELSDYTGKDGTPAYIAVDGIVYDVTSIAQWRGGTHNGFEAGKDLTNEIKNISPHGVSKLKGLPIVGKLIE